MRLTHPAMPTQALAVLCVMYFMLYVDRTNPSIAAPLIKSDLHLRNGDLGWVFSAIAYPYALFQLVGGGTAPLACSMVLLLLGAVLAWFLRPDRPFEADGAALDRGAAPLDVPGRAGRSAGD